MGRGGHGDGGDAPCTPAAAIVFLVALFAGTFCTIFCKAPMPISPAAMGMTTEGYTGEMENTKFPIFFTFAMFLGMSCALPAHFINEACKSKDSGMPDTPKLGLKGVLLLGLPSVFDLLATALTTVGLLHIPASIWQLLRGGAIVLVALMKNFAPEAEGRRLAVHAEGQNPILGMAVTALGTLMQSFQYVYEEKVMADMDCPPLLLIGTEGAFGFVLCGLVLYPIAYAMPGVDHGHYEDPFNTLHKISHNMTLLGFIACYTSLIFVLNSLSIVITYMLSSVWHAILDNFRPVFVWISSLIIFYLVSSGTAGEEWTWPASYVQLLGTVVLLFGTAVYNGSVALPGLEDGEPLKETLLPSEGSKASASPRASIPQLGLNSSPVLAKNVMRVASGRLSR
ncbi:hypothetical protein EMIHUDRAFT_220045 [Emiliania huxleyi CCMP1516]|uniref:EamA domain-containing protein n=2 Tax=Emiliania huxleyi TaxID=2903 RepID=A0A0D3I2X7_EMIH1|nr:hypothetical protein EMIHUDRAFT_220045 [Emiliania huxleyi CCMP1516]EOD05612.1 hypothetical protein EMIHUDRAFT_220045 [Emiliania huxleyi CCMP1516]|eukprot:XP_005758041.1 hypothetical protein EMIHUDRAFT_220045 [Emiliania huxleyi CCMP1516]